MPSKVVIVKKKPKLIKKFKEKPVPISPVPEEIVYNPDELYKQRIIKDIQYRSKSVRQCCQAYFKGKMLVRSCRLYY